MRPKRHLQRTEFYGGSATESVHEYDEAGSLTKSDERTYEPGEAGSMPGIWATEQVGGDPRGVEHLGDPPHSSQQIVGDGTPREDAEIAQEAASIEASDPAAPEIKIPHVGEEPEPPKGRLPDDFPYLTALHAHEPPINTFTQLAKFAEDYTQILGVGPVGAEAITKAVAEAAEPDV